MKTNYQLVGNRIFRKFNAVFLAAISQRIFISCSDYSHTILICSEFIWPKALQISPREQLIFIIKVAIKQTG